jgi:hypothetical protein
MNGCSKGQAHRQNGQAGKGQAAHQNSDLKRLRRFFADRSLLSTAQSVFVTILLLDDAGQDGQSRGYVAPLASDQPH